jgi:predicted RNA binding protein YcfA (HicA-like mRNA interferase family)
MKIRDVLSLLGADGWQVVATRGSHRQLRHPSKPGKLTVAGHPSMELHPKTLRSILQQAQLEEND